ncbi:MAG: hypothetical protein CMF61_00665 [Magnetococcales bacterium]|nr:hypothetical protein [Magnetococcales bacterium]
MPFIYDKLFDLYNQKIDDLHKNTVITDTLVAQSIKAIQNAIDKPEMVDWVFEDCLIVTYVYLGCFSRDEVDKREAYFERVMAGVRHLIDQVEKPKNHVYKPGCSMKPIVERFKKEYINGEKNSFSDDPFGPKSYYMKISIAPNA